MNNTEQSSSTKSRPQYLLLNSVQPENKYGEFTGEILRAEGLNGFSIHDLAETPLPKFQNGDVAILTRCFLTQAQGQHLKAAVENGLRLVCFQPGWHLMQTFGWNPAKRVVHPGWVKIGQGLPGGGETLQTHVPIAIYEADAGANYSVLATAACDHGENNETPAVMRQQLGQGEVVFFFYDLPKAIARLRFGDPERASLLNSGHWTSLHAFDLFEGYVDKRVLHLPQAELQAQLLAHVLTDLCPYPLPRLWYYEKPEQRAAANISSDDDWSMPEHFRDLAGSVAEFGGRVTYYLMPDTYLSDTEVGEMRAQGHSFGAHVNTVTYLDEASNSHVVDDDWIFNYPRNIREQTDAFVERYGESSLTLQCHWAPWIGYMTMVPHFVESGYRMLYSHMNHSQDLNRYMCGAGRPVKYFDESGTLFDCWQQPMHTYDDGSIEIRISENLEELQGEFESFLRPVLQRFHTTIGMGSHPISFSSYSKPFLRHCFSVLQREGVPIYSGDDWCRFNDRRHAVTMACRETTTGQSSINVANAEGTLTLMVPLDKIEVDAQVHINGVEVEGQRYRRLERDYLYIELQGDGANDLEITIEGASS